MQEDIENAVKALKEGKVILYPTDTVWGVGCDAGNAEAVKKVLEVKNSDEGKSLIILVADENQILNYVKKIPELAWELMEYSEKPITIIYPEGRNVAPGLLAEDGSIAIRVVKDEFCKQLIRKFKGAITSTSANISGEPTPADFAAIDEKIRSRVGYIVSHRQNDKSKATPSTIVKVGYNGEIKFIRK
jgi:L-threonylcarbamoyladenylate synthase